jgi:hypothetical protein
LTSSFQKKKQEEKESPTPYGLLSKTKRQKEKREKDECKK